MFPNFTSLVIDKLQATVPTKKACVYIRETEESEQQKQRRFTNPPFRWPQKPFPTGERLHADRDAGGGGPLLGHRQRGARAR